MAISFIFNNSPYIEHRWYLLSMVSLTIIKSNDNKMGMGRVNIQTHHTTVSYINMSEKKLETGIENNERFFF